MMDENGPFVAFSDIFFKYFSSSHSFTQCTVRDFQYHFTGMHTRHCVALSVIIPPPTNFRRQKKKQKENPKTCHACVGWVPAGLSSALCSPSQPQKRMDRVGLVHCCGRFDCPYTSSTISSVNRSVTAIRTDCDTTASA
jgi:hypothetical protein